MTQNQTQDFYLTELIIAKQRNGPIGSTIKFDEKNKVFNLIYEII
jgi:replicative DNA helicase